VGNAIKLDCTATGYPQPIVKWTKNDGKPFTSRSEGPIYLSAYDFALSLKDVVPSDSGLYTCNVSNVYGWFNRTYRVDVRGKDLYALFSSCVNTAFNFSCLSNYLS